MQDGGCPLRVGKVVVDAERELEETRALVVEVGAAAREPFDDYVSEIALQMAEVMRRVPIDEGERGVQARDHVCGRDIRPGILDDNRYAEHSVSGNRLRRPAAGK